MSWRFSVGLIGLLVVLQLSGCASQAALRTMLPVHQSTWSSPTTPGDVARNPEAPWWTLLAEPALAPLLERAEHDAPTLQLAWSRIAEARAVLDGSGATRRPQLGWSAGSSRGNSESMDGLSQTRTDVGLTLSWEVDLFGRLRQAQEAAQARVDARQFDAEATRLSLQSQMASTLLDKRACEAAATQLNEQVDALKSRTALIERRVGVGLSPSVERARSLAALSETRQSLATQQAHCRQLSQSLGTLAGMSAPEVDRLLDACALASWPRPLLAPALPGTVLGGHPVLRSAMREADAAYAELGSARAAQLPSLSLSGLLSRQWLGLATGAASSTLWSLGADLGGSVFDGGSRHAQVQAADARYRQAIAKLQQVLLETVADVESALNEGHAAEQRLVLAQSGVAAAGELFAATDASWRVGRSSQIDLEDARRSLLTAQSTLTEARRDRTKAWVALVKATGGATPSESS